MVLLLLLLLNKSKSEWKCKEYTHLLISENESSGLVKYTALQKLFMSVCKMEDVPSDTNFNVTRKIQIYVRPFKLKKI